MSHRFVNQNSLRAPIALITVPCLKVTTGDCQFAGQRRDSQCAELWSASKAWLRFHAQWAFLRVPVASLHDNPPAQDGKANHTGYTQPLKDLVTAFMCPSGQRSWESFYMFSLHQSSCFLRNMGFQQLTKTITIKSLQKNCPNLGSNDGFFVSQYA